MTGIYKITNTKTGDYYIGSSKNIKERWKHHKSRSYWKHQPNSRMYSDMNTYGLDIFTFEVIETLKRFCTNYNV